jgi:D-serine deaminase-like pyridoxal phosphate-dependent protein
MKQSIFDLRTPAILVEADKLEANLRSMQDCCNAAGVELWPHCKTHKMVQVLKRQIGLGAAGATVAKVSEAEALLPSGVRNVFIAHSLVDLRLAPRLAALSSRLDRLVLAVTSVFQLEALERLLDAAGINVEALLAVDTGLSREGARTSEAAKILADKIRKCQRLDLIGIYTHEGHAYGAASGLVEATVENVHQRLLEYRWAVGGDLPLWPGCSVTAKLMAGREGVRVVRPGSYCFGDLFLTEATGVMPADAPALTVLSTVIDHPEPGLALLDAGSKVFSSDKLTNGISAKEVGNSEIMITRFSEEHGFVVLQAGFAPPIGERWRFVPAHVCPVVNLASEVHLVQGVEVIETWTVEARGCSI